MKRLKNDLIKSCELSFKWTARLPHYFLAKILGIPFTIKSLQKGKMKKHKHSPIYGNTNILQWQLHFYLVKGNHLQQRSKVQSGV